MKTNLVGLKAINENPVSGFIQYENEDKLSWWMPGEFYKIWKEHDNVRRSRDYFRLERDNLKKLHERVMEEAHNRIDAIQNKALTVDAQLNSVLKEVEFMRHELDLAERDVVYWKTVCWALAITCLGLFCMIIFKAL